MQNFNIFCVMLVMKIFLKGAHTACMHDSRVYTLVNVLYSLYCTQGKLCYNIQQIVTVLNFNN